MSKTEDILNMLKGGETDTAKIKEKTGASEALISRCRKKYEDATKKEEEKPRETEEEEPTDEEIDGVINRICIKPEKRFLSSSNEEKEEDYRCMGCGHEWKSKKTPLKCPNCGCEF